MEKEILDILKNLVKDFQGFKQDIDKKFDSLESQVDSLKSQVQENTQILKSLEHSAQINKSEHDNMMNDIAHIKGDIEAIKKDLFVVEEVTAKNWADINSLKRVK